MGFAAAELRNQRQHRGSVGGFAGKAPQHHSSMFRQRPREAGPREKLFRFGVVFGRGAADDLLKRNREFVGTERSSFADLSPRDRNPIPRVQGSSPYAARSSTNSSRWDQSAGFTW